MDDDLMQAKLLWKKRVDFLINDPNVVFYTISQADIPEPEKWEMTDSLEVIKPIIQYNDLYFAVSKKKPNWRHTLDVINQGIRDFENDGALIRIIRHTSDRCGYETEGTLALT